MTEMKYSRVAPPQPFISRLSFRSAMINMPRSTCQEDRVYSGCVRVFLALMAVQAHKSIHFSKWRPGSETRQSTPAKRFSVYWKHTECSVWTMYYVFGKKIMIGCEYMIQFISSFNLWGSCGWVVKKIALWRAEPQAYFGLSWGPSSAQIWWFDDTNFVHAHLIQTCSQAGMRLHRAGGATCLSNIFGAQLSTSSIWLIF